MKYAKPCIRPRITVVYLVICAIFFLPSSPSLDSLSSAGIATHKSCRIMDELIYGVTPMANMAPYSNPPPERSENAPKISLLPASAISFA